MAASPEKRYSEDEVRAIFQETARRHASLRTVDSPGLTLSELTAIAREAGLDPTLVAAAAAHVSEAEEPETGPWDVPSMVRTDRVLPGSVPDELWERIVDDLRGVFGQSGRAGQMGRIREWTTSGPTKASGNTAPVHVELRPEGDQTRVTITQSLAGYRRSAMQSSSILGATGVILSALILLVGGFSQLGTLAFVASIMFGMAVIMSVGLYRTARREYRGQSARFERALDRIDLLALKGAHDVRSMEPLPEPLSSPLMDDTIAPEQVDAPPQARQRTRE